MKLINVVLILALGLLCGSACKKTYEEGPAFSLRTKMNRITGKWKLVSLENVPRLQPELDQYLEFTRNENGDGTYEANFTNFQSEYSVSGPDGDALFTTSGSWKFLMASDFSMDQYEDKECINLQLDVVDTFIPSNYKIKRLTNDELILYPSFYYEVSYYYVVYGNKPVLTFEKVK